MAERQQAAADRRRASKTQSAALIPARSARRARLKRLFTELSKGPSQRRKRRPRQAVPQAAELSQSVS